MTFPVFEAFPKIPRWSRQITISEKIDGTNAGVYVSEDGLDIAAASRSGWITPEKDNHGFAKWVRANETELLRLGPGMHFGEWFGAGIQRKYGLDEKRFALFNTAKWTDDSVRPACCHVVPVLYRGPLDEVAISGVLFDLEVKGSVAAPGFMDPEGVVIWHEAARQAFKKTIEHDAEYKGKQR